MNMCITSGSLLDISDMNFTILLRLNFYFFSEKRRRETINVYFIFDIKGCLFGPDKKDILFGVPLFRVPFLRRSGPLGKCSLLMFVIKQF